MRKNRAASALMSWVMSGVPLFLPILGGCVIVTNGGCYERAAYKATRVSTVAHQPASPVSVETGNGAVEVVQGGADSVEVTAHLAAVTQERLDAARVITERQGDGTLRVSVDWPEGKRRPNEACAFVVRIPDARGVTIKTSNGAVTVRGLSGAADLRTSNGAIEVTDHAGVVTADTSNGRVVLTNVQGAHADSSNGRIEVRLADGATGPVRLDTSNGDIRLQVPATFMGRVRCDTSNGRVSDSTGRARALSQSRGEALYAFGDAGEESVLDTSNGSITIEAAR